MSRPQVADEAGIGDSDAVTGAAGVSESNSRVLAGTWAVPPGVPVTARVGDPRAGITDRTDVVPTPRY